MAKNNFKEILEYIQKYGAGRMPPGVAATTPAVSGTTSGGRPPPTSPIGTGTARMPAIPAVQEMQRAMQDLANAVMRDAQSATMARKPGDALQPTANPEVMAAKKGFNDFIAEQYLGGLDSDKKGVEWSTDKSVTSLPAKQESQTDIYELDAVMDTFRRIGMGVKEFNPDGVWGPRTDNALRNMMGFAYALLQVEGDFGLKNPGYTYDNWKQFQQLLSGYTIDASGRNSMPANEQAARAAQITKHLKAIANMYTNQFRTGVLARPEFRPLLEGNRSFEKYDSSGTDKDILTPQEQALANLPTAKVTGISFQAPGLPGGKIDAVPLYALRSKDDLEKYLKYMGWSDDNIDAGIGTKFLNAVKQQLQSKGTP